MLFIVVDVKQCPGSIHRSSHQVHKTQDVISVEGSRRLSQRKDNLRFANCGNATSSFQDGFQHLAPVSTSFLNVHTHHSAAVSSCFLDTDCLAAALEKTLMGFDLCSALSKYSLEQNLNPASNPPGLWKHPNPRKVCFTLNKFLETKQVGLGFATAASSPIFLS